MLPTLEHVVQAIITSAICFICLWPFRKALGFAEKEVGKHIKDQRKAAIKQHYFDGHDDKLRYCQREACAVLSSIDGAMAH